MIGEGLPSPRQRRVPRCLPCSRFSSAWPPAPPWPRTAVLSPAASSTAPAACCRAFRSRVVNTATNATSNVVTNETGNYTALYLIPGTYTVTATLTGFKTVKQGDIIVRVGDRIVIDLDDGAGRRRRADRRHGAVAVLETGTATMGQVIDAKLIAEIPLGDGTAYGLTRLIPGATFERSYALQRPMDNDNLRGMTVTGTISSEFSIDGSSNVGVAGARRHPAARRGDPGIQGRTPPPTTRRSATPGAGSVNLALKSGTNRFSLAGSFYNRDDSRSEDLFASIRNNTGKTIRDYNRYGAHRIAARSSRTRPSSWRRSRSCRTTPRSRSRRRSRPRRCATATSPNCSRPACRFSIRSRRALVGGVVTRDAFHGQHHPGATG